jgi:hypothetical protein
VVELSSFAQPAPLAELGVAEPPRGSQGWFGHPQMAKRPPPNGHGLAFSLFQVGRKPPPNFSYLFILRI